MILESYPTPAGAVEISYAPHSGVLRTRCPGCGDIATTRTGAQTWDPPEKEDALVDQALPEVREQAAGHAAACEQAPALPPDHGFGTAGTGCPF